jgi:DNA repair protein RAD7
MLLTKISKLISKHIDDVEALGDLGSANMEAIAKAICRNRTLYDTSFVVSLSLLISIHSSSENVMLFHDVNNKTLFLHDVTSESYHVPFLIPGLTFLP